MKAKMRRKAIQTIEDQVESRRQKLSICGTQSCGNWIINLFIQNHWNWDENITAVLLKNKSSG